MKKSSLTQLSIKSSLAAEEPIATLLQTLFATSPSSYSDAETGLATISIFLKKSVAQLEAVLPELRIGLQRISECGLDLAPLEIHLAPLPQEDWAESWKKHFKPLLIGRSLLIKPSWSQRQPLPGQAVVVLDPGLSFGTGQHATTSFCLREITARHRKGRGFSLLDAGCGSGILAISAAKLGCHPVDAFDFDPVAVRIAQKNCQANHVTHQVHVQRRDLTKMPSKSRATYDLVCANLISPLLLQERDKLLNRLRSGGTIVLAGILATEFAKVQAEYENAGLKLLRSKLEKEWRSGSFHKPR